MEKKKSIVNIINFIRGVEPRGEVDLHAPVREQLALLEKHGLTGTFLLQYDAMLDPFYIEALKGTPHEVGVWLEIMQPLVEAAGIPWRGRFPWDWHSHVGFSVGYPPREREIICDVLMEKFRSIFGHYPKSVGSWMIDAHTLSYLSERYGVLASCNCKDQWGTDGYTLWGGYYGQAYYPCKANAYAPAQSVENQIPIPVFKMLGPDPIYQYDLGLSAEEGGARWQQVVTLEPVYTKGGGGGDPDWVRWFFSEVMQSACVSFRYAQAGQENSFGWPAMEKGLKDQFALIAKMSRDHLLDVQTLADSARWFHDAYPQTPNAAITALSDWKDEGKQSIWFCTKRYRINLYAEGERMWIRDLMMFDDGYPERYMNAVCDNPNMLYDNLPIIDGNRASGGSIRAGCYFGARNGEPTLLDIAVSEDQDRLIVNAQMQEGLITFTLDTDTLQIDTDIEDFALIPRFHKSPSLESATLSGESIVFSHEGMRYAIKLTKGIVYAGGLLAEDGHIEIKF